MPTPTKPFEVLINEKKSHRTKAELNLRKQGEAALATGVAFKERPEVRANAMAHKEFVRLKKLFSTIKKNDAIYEGVINRYCLLVAECNEFEKMKSMIIADLKELSEKLKEREIEYLEYLEYKDKLQNKLFACDKQIQTKRKMLLEVEKENIMTIASALRSIPKKQEKASNPLREALKKNG